MPNSASRTSITYLLTDKWRFATYVHLKWQSRHVVLGGVSYHVLEHSHYGPSRRACLALRLAELCGYPMPVGTRLMNIHLVPQ